MFVNKLGIAVFVKFRGGGPGEGDTAEFFRTPPPQKIRNWGTTSKRCRHRIMSELGGGENITTQTLIAIHYMNPVFCKRRWSVQIHTWGRILPSGNRSPRFSPTPPKITLTHTLLRRFPYCNRGPYLQLSSRYRTRL